MQYIVKLGITKVKTTYQNALIEQSPNKAIVHVLDTVATICVYCITQNFDVKLWQISHFRVLARKMLVNLQ